MKKSDYKIAIIGLGYVGLPLAVAFAENSSEVCAGTSRYTGIAASKFCAACGLILENKQRWDGAG